MHTLDGADVQAPDRLRYQHHARVMADLPAQDDFLLVSSGELPDLLVNAGDLCFIIYQAFFAVFFGILIAQQEIF